MRVTTSAAAFAANANVAVAVQGAASATVSVAVVAVTVPQATVLEVIDGAKDITLELAVTAGIFLMGVPTQA